MSRAIVFLLFLAPIAIAQAPDPIAATLAAARADYQSTRESMKRKVAERFEAAEDVATKAGDTKMVNLVDDEREAFLKGDQWGFKSINVGDLDRTREASGKAWKSALRDAARAYTLRKMKAEARSVQAEIDAIEKVEAGMRDKEANRAFDAFQAGTIWAGDRTWSDGGVLPFELTITERSGARFRGETLTDNKNHHNVAGMIRNGKVDWDTVPAPQSRQRLNFAGAIKDDTLMLEFKGINPAGNPVNGTAKLTLKR